MAVIDWQENQQVERRALEDSQQANDQTHYKELLDAQTSQARLRDQLATADRQSNSPPAPAAWIMEALEPNLPQLLLSELSLSSEMVTRD